MLKEVIYHNVGDSMNTSTYTAPTHVSRLHTVDGFIALVVADRIVNACGQANTLPIQGHLPGINHLWAILYKHIQAMIKHLNAQIASRAPAQYSLHAIVDLLSIDVSLQSGILRQVEGVLTDAALCDGSYLEITYRRLCCVSKVIRRCSDCSSNKDEDRAHGPAIRHNVRLLHPPCWTATNSCACRYATLANTASPANNQITGLSNWSHEDIAAAYSHTGFHPAPCPTSVLQDIVRITRLRTMVFGEPEMATAFRPIARDIAERLNDFDPHAWEEPFSTPEDPCSPLAGDLYKTSALLYALQSLPAILAVEFGYVEEQRRHLSVFFAKRHYTDHLYALVHRAMEELPAKQAVSWPMAVLGVAMQDAPQEDKDQIIAYLLRLRKIPGADGGAASIEKKLKDFWFFKQTEWEECYHEPINVIT